MITRLSNIRLAFSMSISALALVLVIGSADAGGPMLVDEDTGLPIVWARSEFRGGPLDSVTVDNQGRVVYHVDSGPLGPLSNEEAVALTDHIFRLYSEIPGSSLNFVNGGPILDPDTGQPVNVTGNNVGKFLGNRPTLSRIRSSSIRTIRSWATTTCSGSRASSRSPRTGARWPKAPWC